MVSFRDNALVGDQREQQNEPVFCDLGLQSKQERVSGSVSKEQNVLHARADGDCAVRTQVFERRVIHYSLERNVVQLYLLRALKPDAHLVYEQLELEGVGLLRNVSFCQTVVFSGEHLEAVV